MSSSIIRTFGTELTLTLASVEGIRVVHVFGSILHAAHPNDVDLAVIYGEPLTPFSASDVRPTIEAVVSDVFGLPAHLTFFTPEEADRSPLLHERVTVYERQPDY